MSDIEKLTPQNLLLLIQFVAPGFLAVYCRSLFVRRIEASFKDNLLLFVVISVVYSFVTLPLWTWLDLGHWSELQVWALWFAALVIVPVLGGTLLGVSAQRGWLHAFLSTLGMKPLSPYRTGWDWSFSQVEGHAFLLVTLDDRSTVAGLFSGQSLAASDYANRDLFLESVYNVDQAGNWSERNPREGILISGKCIRYIEFFRGNS